MCEVATITNDTTNTLASGSYEDSITKEWMDNVGDATRGYVNLVFWVYSIDGLNDAMGYFPYVTSNMIRVAKDYAIVAQNARRLNPNWLQNLFHNIRYYIVIARYLSKRNVRFSTIWEAVWGLSRLTTAYTQLGQAVKKLNNELRELDVEKLNALKSFNSSVVLLSLMDPEQFRDMMDELEEKGGSLFKAIDETKEEGKKTGNNKIENKTQPVKTTTPTNNKSGGKTLDDIWNIMNTHLPGIAKDAQSIGSFVSNIGDEVEAMLKRS